MRRLIWPVLFLLLILLQGAASVFFTGWLSFDLPLLFLYSFSLLRGQDKGALAGALIGFVQDAMTIGVFGFHIFTRGVFGFLIGYMKEKIVKDQPYFHILLIGLTCICIRLCYLIIELLRFNGDLEIIGFFAWNSLGYVLGNMLFVLPMMYLVNFVYAWIKAEDVSY